MAGGRRLLDTCTRTARPAPPAHSPRRHAVQPDPERLARAGMPALPTRGWAAVFGFMGMGKSLSCCRCCHLLCCWPQHSIYLNPIHNCRCIRACRQACQGICPRAVRAGFDPQACGARQAPLAAIRRLAARDEVRCSLHIAAVPCPHARSHVVTSLCFCMAGCGCGFELGY